MDIHCSVVNLEFWLKSLAAELISEWFFWSKKLPLAFTFEAFVTIKDWEVLSIILKTTIKRFREDDC